MEEAMNILIQKARGGDAQATEELLAAFEKRVYNLALRMMLNAHDAQDVAQESMIKIFRSLPSLQTDCSFTSWVYRITVNTCLDELRRRKKRAYVNLDDLLAQQVPLTQTTQHSVEEEFLHREQLANILQTIDTLDEEARTVILLRDVQGLAYQEIAQMLDCRVGTVKSRIHRARKKLIKMLDDAGRQGQQAKLDAG